MSREKLKTAIIGTFLTASLIAPGASKEARAAEKDSVINLRSTVAEAAKDTVVSKPEWLQIKGTIEQSDYDEITNDERQLIKEELVDKKDSIKIDLPSLQEAVRIASGETFYGDTVWFGPWRYPHILEISDWGLILRGKTFWFGRESKKEFPFMNVERIDSNENLLYPTLTIRMGTIYSDMQFGRGSESRKRWQETVREATDRLQRFQTTGLQKETQESENKIEKKVINIGDGYKIVDIPGVGKFLQNDQGGLIRLDNSFQEPK